MSSGGQDGSGDGVFGQRFNSAGTPLGSEFQVNSYTTGSQQRPAVAVDGSGNFVVVWSSSGGDGSYAGVFGQLFTAGGSPVGGNFQVNTYTTFNQFSPTVAADASGEFVVAWGSPGQDGGGYGVFGQRFGAEGGTAVGSEFRVNRTTAGDQGAPAVAAAGSGEFVVAWVSDGQDGSQPAAFSGSACRPRRSSATSSSRRRSGATPRPRCARGTASPVARRTASASATICVSVSGIAASTPAPPAAYAPLEAQVVREEWR